MSFYTWVILYKQVEFISPIEKRNVPYKIIITNEKSKIE